MCSAQADNSGDKLIKRALKAMPFDLADLDKTTQGKASAQTTPAKPTVETTPEKPHFTTPTIQDARSSLESRAAIILEAVAACMGLLFVWWKAMQKLANSGTLTDCEQGLKENLLAASQDQAKSKPAVAEQIERLIAESNQPVEQLKSKELMKQVKEPVSPLSKKIAANETRFQSTDRKQKEERKKSLNDLAAWISKDQPKPTEWLTCGPGKDEAKPGVPKSEETPKEYTAKEIIQIGQALNDPKAVIKPMVGGTSPRSPRSPQAIASGYGQVAQPFKQVIAQSVKQTTVGMPAAPGSFSPRIVSSPVGSIASFPQTQPVVVRTMRQG